MNKLRQLLGDQEDGLVVANDGYTVAQAVEDWLTTSPTRLPTPSCCSATGADPPDCPRLGLPPMTRRNQGRSNGSQG
jgi:hypothetical protein